MRAGWELSQLEGIIPAIETAHAFAIFKYKTFKPDDILVFNCSGRGDKDQIPTSHILTYRHEQNN